MNWCNLMDAANELGATQGVGQAAQTEAGVIIQGLQARESGVMLLSSDYVPLFEKRICHPG